MLPSCVYNNLKEQFPGIVPHEKRRILVNNVFGNPEYIDELLKLHFIDIGYLSRYIETGERISNIGNVTDLIYIMLLANKIENFLRCDTFIERPNVTEWTMCSFFCANCNGSIFAHKDRYLLEKKKELLNGLFIFGDNV